MPRLVHVAVVFAILWINACAASSSETQCEANPTSCHRHKHHFAETAVQTNSRLTDIKTDAQRSVKSVHDTPQSDGTENKIKQAVLRHAQYAEKPKYNDHLAMNLEEDDHDTSEHSNLQSAQTPQRKSAEAQITTTNSKQANSDSFLHLQNSNNIAPTLTFSHEEDTADSASQHSHTSRNNGEGTDPASHITTPATADSFSDLPLPDFQPMRIAAFTRSLYVDTKYCESSSGTEWDTRRDFWNNKIFCSTDEKNSSMTDTFTEEKRNAIKNTILPAVIKSFSNRPLRYRIPGERLQIPYLRYGNRCQHFMSPESHWSYGVRDADVVLYVGAMPMNKSIDPNPVRAEPCASVDGRVVAVALNFNPKHILDGQTVIDAAIKDVSRAIGAATCPNKTSVIMTQQFNRHGDVYGHCAAAYFNKSKQSMRVYDEKARQWFECSKEYTEKRWTRTGLFNCQLAKAPNTDLGIGEKQAKSTDSVAAKTAEEHTVTEMHGFMVRVVSKDAVKHKMRHEPATERASAHSVRFAAALLALSFTLLALPA